MTHVVNLIFFVTIGARAQAETTTEEIGLRVAHRAVKICGVFTCCTVWVALEALRAYLNKAIGASTDRSYTD
jgi:hypothetical protein